MRRVLVFVVLLTLTPAPAEAGRAAQNFTAHLSGGQEVPPVGTKASGQVKLAVNDSRSELRFKLVVAHLEGVTQAHIHCGSAGVNGQIMAFLFGPASPGVDVSGILAQGTITEEDLVAGSVEACTGGSGGFENFLGLLMTGNAYVNVHTEAHPSGEIRGQIAPHG